MPIRIALALLLVTGCDDATGSVQGGQPLSCPPSDGSSTWSALYEDYFGPCGTASCSGQSYCHSSAASTGSQVSGFTCGPTQESCWEGAALGVAADAGGIFPPIASSGQLISALHKASPTGNDLDNMPCGGPVPEAGPPPCLPAAATYAFTPADLARISAWIQQGAQDN